MPVFIALIILQSIVKKPTNEQYWSKRHSISTPFFSKVMSYRRFNLIYRFLHFSANETFVTETHECPKLSKIWPVLQYLTIRFKEVVTPDRDVTIDESLMIFKGRLGWKQYKPLKRSRFGIKSYMLCESKSGYVWSLIIYTGKGTLFDEKYKHMCMSSQVVMTLMEPLLNKGHCLTTDNFYSSPELADILIQSLTDMYGTLKPTRKDVPKELLSKKIDKGQMIAYQRGKVCVMKWMNKKAVCLISTIHNPEMVQVQSHKNEIRRKYKAVMKYNNTMGGVDRLDKHLTNYPLIKKGERGITKIFFHVLDICLCTIFVLYKKNDGKDSHLQFRIDIVDCLIERYGEVSGKKGRPGTSTQSNEID
ncbi:piggyBac transposable element-derived protein 4 [Trichonephila clavipes]|nr:piggyBac transposable element-derived protein 4 [Trichonephila clavipes]